MVVTRADPARAEANRSGGGRLLDAVVEGVALDGLEAGVFDEGDDLLLGHLDLAVCFDRVALGEFAALGDGAVDRKSTRLNSSHANISYAVFCLKKKKK